MNQVAETSYQDRVYQAYAEPLTPAPVPSIASSAVLVSLSRSVPKMTKIDKQVTAEVTTAKHASRSAGKFQKKLLNCSVLEALHTLSGQIYSYHIENTVAWTDRGPRLLPNEKLIDYKNTMEAFFVEAGLLWEEFLRVYPSRVANVQLNHMGDMFNESDYPTVEELRRKFRMAVSYEPIPDAGDFRVDIGNQAAQEMADTYNTLLQDRIAGAMNDVVERLTTPLINMSKMLDYHDGEKPTGFRDTLVDNVTSIVDLLRTCNLTNDARLTDLQQQLKRTLTGVTPDGLRRDPNLRAKTKQDVDTIIKNLPSLGF
jgi:hypothetical protein